MAKKTWTFDLDGVQHTVQLEHGVLSGKRLITVDGQLLKDIKHNLIDLGGDYPLAIDGHTGFLRISTNGLTFGYDLIMDGKSLTTEKPRLPKTPAQLWALFFAGACVPMFTMGGALPVVLGLGGAAACLYIARDPKRSPRFQVAASFAIALVAWIAVLFITFGAALLQAGPP